MKSLIPSLLAAALITVSGCSINKLAINAVSDALTGEGGTEVFTGDNDPQLVGDAIPFALKMYEALLSQNPTHQGLILTTGSVFVMYANAFVQGPAEFLPQDQYEQMLAAYERAKNLYLRGAAILLRGLDLKYPGFSALYEGGELTAALAKMKAADVPYLYWTAAAVISAFSINPFDSALGDRVSTMMAYMARAYELDPDFNNGALDEFYMMAYAALPWTMGGNPELVPEYFERAVAKSGGKTAGPYVSYAQSVAIPAQDYDTFKSCLEQALAIDAEADPANRLVNVLAQRKARILLERQEDYFFFVDGKIWKDDAEGHL